MVGAGVSKVAPTIEASGVVVDIDGESAVVKMDEIGCGRCHEEGGCGGNNIAQAFCNSPRVFRVSNERHVVIGERVTIAALGGTVRQSAVLAYGVPLLCLFVGAVLGAEISGDTGAIFGAMGGLFCAWACLKCAVISHKSSVDSAPFIKD